MNSFLSFATTLASSYGSGNSSSDDFLNAILAAYVGIIIVVSVVSVAAAILLVICQCLQFKKAGQPWYAAFIPFWNMYVWCDICFDKGWLFLLFFVPGLNGFFALYLYYQTGRVFGHGVGFNILCILLPVVTFPIIAFSSNEYDYNKATFLG